MPEGGDLCTDHRGRAHRDRNTVDVLDSSPEGGTTDISTNYSINLPFGVRVQG